MLGIARIQWEQLELTNNQKMLLLLNPEVDSQSTAISVSHILSRWTRSQAGKRQVLSTARSAS